MNNIINFEDRKEESKKMEPKNRFPYNFEKVKVEKENNKVVSTERYFSFFVKIFDRDVEKELKQICKYYNNEKHESNIAIEKCASKIYEISSTGMTEEEQKRQMSTWHILMHKYSSLASISRQDQLRDERYYPIIFSDQPIDPEATRPVVPCVAI